jgi:hypothetical protein
LLRIYSQSIKLAGGDDDIKALFFSMALETMPPQWFVKLSPGLKQKGGESLKDYYRRFGELRVQVHDITE